MNKAALYSITYLKREQYSEVLRIKFDLALMALHRCDRSGGIRVIHHGRR